MVMRNLVYIALVLSVLSCGKISPKGEIKSEDIRISQFENLELQGKYHLFYIHSPESFINVETYDNIANNLEIENDGKTLIIKEKRETENVDFYNITIYAPHYPREISVSDAVEMTISGEIKTEQLRIHLKDNAKFIGAINTQKTDLEMHNTSRANFTGATQNAYIKVADTAHIIAPYWQINTLNIEAKNGNYTEVNVKDTIKGKLENTSKFLYYNEPVRAFNADKNTKVSHEVLD